MRTLKKYLILVALGLAIGILLASITSCSSHIKASKNPTGTPIKRTAVKRWAL